MSLIPEKIYIGDTLYFKFNTGKTPDDTLINDINNFSVHLKLRGPSDIDIQATNDSGNSWIVQVYAGQQVQVGGDPWVDGIYKYVLYATRQVGSPEVTDSYTIENGLVILEDRTDTLSSPVTSIAQYKTAYESIEAVLQNRATKDQESYSIAGRSLSRTPVEDLIRLRGFYFDLYQRELNRTTARKNKIKVRLQ